MSRREGAIRPLPELRAPEDKFERLAPLRIEGFGDRFRSGEGLNEARLSAIHSRDEEVQT